MASTKTFAIGEWDTFHNNGPFPTKMLHITELEGKGNMPSSTDRYNDCAQEIQRLIQEALNNNEGFRAYGSAWSLSAIAHHKDRMHYNGNMNLKMTIDADDLHANTNYHHKNLFFIECGNTIKEISNFLSAHGKSLKASGASNGQTIGGSISTGVHGAGLDAGAVQDFVVGINLIIGPNKNEIVYLERHSKPALNELFLQKINTRIIRNDDLFNAALVGLGGFGFIHGVVIEGEDRFLLKRYVKKIDKNIALELAKTMDFENSSFTIPQEVDSSGKGLRPYHYKIFVNPYRNDNEYVVELMYKKEYKLPYPDPFPRIKTAIYKDLITLFTKIAEKFPKNIPWLVDQLRNTIMPQVDEEVTGTLAEIFWDAPHQGPAFACSVGIDHKDSPKALELLSKLVNDEGPIPGIFAMRFVKQSQATLAFTKFPITCMLEIDGVLWEKTNNIISLTEFSKRIIEVLMQNGILFTGHWGKNSDWAFPGLVEHMFGNKMKIWKNYRNSLLSPEMAQLFSNNFLEMTNLAQPENDIPQDLIVSL